MVTKIYFERYDQTIEDFLNAQKPLTARGYKTGLRLVFLYPNWLDNQPNQKISGAEMIAHKGPTRIIRGRKMPFSSKSG